MYLNREYLFSFSSYSAAQRNDVVYLTKSEQRKAKRKREKSGKKKSNWIWKAFFSFSILPCTRYLVSLLCAYSSFRIFSLLNLSCTENSIRAHVLRKAPSVFLSVLYRIFRFFFLFFFTFFLFFFFFLRSFGPENQATQSERNENGFPVDVDGRLSCMAADTTFPFPTEKWEQCLVWKIYFVRCKCSPLRVRQ